MNEKIEYITKIKNFFLQTLKSTPLQKKKTKKHQKQNKIKK
jgi:hypothetical protein